MPHIKQLSLGCNHLNTRSLRSLVLKWVQPKLNCAYLGHLSTVRNNLFLKQRQLSVDSTWRWINIESTLFQRRVPTGRVVNSYGKYSIPNLSNLSEIPRENEILSQRGFDWTTRTPSESAPVSHMQSSYLNELPQLPWILVFLGRYNKVLKWRYNVFVMISLVQKPYFIYVGGNGNILRKTKLIFIS